MIFLRGIAALVFAVGMVIGGPGRADNGFVVFPLEEGRSQQEQMASFPFQLLDQALDRGGLDARLVPSPAPISENRQRVLLEADHPALDVAWFGTSREFESRASFVPIPVYGGLLGWRVGFIKRGQQEAFSAVATLADLRRFTLLQGTGWSDVDILRAAGLNVVTAQYEALPRMISARRADYFPRGVVEVFREYRELRISFPDLSIEREIVIVYPFAMFYFCRKNDNEICPAIERGLRSMHRDGSFRRLLFAHPDVGPALERSDLRNRRVLRVENPVWSTAAATIPAEFWFQP